MGKGLVICWMETGPRLGCMEQSMVVDKVYCLLILAFFCSILG